MCSETNASGKPPAIYICSPYRPILKTEADRNSELEANLERAKHACRMIVSLGCMPLAPHLYFTQFLNDRSQEERSKGMALGLQWLEQADELWVFGNVISDGMSAEIARARELGLPVRCMPEPCRAVEMLLREMQKKETVQNESEDMKNEKQ